MAIIKFGHENIDINENDIILDNGSHYVIITKEVRSGFNSHHPTISKTEFNDLRTHGMIFTNNDLMRTACENEKSNAATYWKFKMELINQYYG